MFLGKKQKATSMSRPPRRSRSLRLESLETRKVLTGVVDVIIDPVGAPGMLTLEGDASNNAIEIRSTGQPGEYSIQGTSGTLLQINGAGVTMPSVTINGIVDDIMVDLAGGNDTFNFLGIDGGGQSNVASDLMITNSGGSNLNILNNVVINEDLNVVKNAANSGYAELRILNSRVIGDTIVDNTGGGSGDSMTVIDTSHLQGGGTGEDALVVTNGFGQDTLDVRGNSQFGTGPFIAAQPIVSITNGDGGSRTTFTGSSQVAGPGSTTIYGDLSLTNGDNLPGMFDILTFNQVNVLGNVDVDNLSGDTTTLVIASTLGSHLTAGGPGGPASFSNDDGFDSFSASDSTIPWGLFIDNDSANGGDSLWGSSTTITDSNIGTRALAIGGDAFELIGDDAADVIDISGTIFGEMVDLSDLGNGLNSLSFSSASSAPYLEYLGGDSNDLVDIDDSAITIEVIINLGSGADTLLITNVDPATQWPSPLLGAITLDGGLGVDSTNLDAITLGALNFELIV